MSISIRGFDNIGSELRAVLRSTVRELANTTHKVVTKNTPVQTGYTRKHWRKQVANESFKVENKVPWIDKLENGSSKQAPNGIVGPSLKEIRRTNK